MSATLATLAIAAVAVLGCMGSVLLLAFRIGRLTGVTETKIGDGDKDRHNIWQQLGVLAGKLDRHIETKHSST